MHKQGDLTFKLPLFITIITVYDAYNTLNFKLKKNEVKIKIDMKVRIIIIFNILHNIKETEIYISSINIVSTLRYSYLRLEVNR